MAACESAALAMVPEAIVTLSELMRHSQDDRVRTRCAEILLERGLGKPREAPPEAVEETLREPISFAISFVSADPVAPLERPNVDAEPSDPPPEPISPAPSAQFDCEEIDRLEAEMQRVLRELEAARREAAFDVDDECDFLA
jgi:hypothetical protein